MDIFFSEDSSKSMGAIIDDEHRHCARVLRHLAGDEIQVFDGNGTLSYALITDVMKDKTLFTVVSKTAIKRPLHRKAIAISPTKSPDRLEWFVEKTTEIGLTDIYFVKCERSEKNQINLERLNRIALSATKQSKRYWKPVLHDLQKFDEFVLKSSDFSERYIAHCNYSILNKIKSTTNQDSIILIGPEGDFTLAEVDLALQNSFQEISLGETRLRTETAGMIAASHLFY